MWPGLWIHRHLIRSGEQGQAGSSCLRTDDLWNMRGSDRSCDDVLDKSYQETLRVLAL